MFRACNQQLTNSRNSASHGRLLAVAARMFLAGALLTPLLFRGATAQNARAFGEVQTVFSRRASGNAFFNRNLRAALRARGLRFTLDPKRADAYLDTSGRGLSDGGFAGQMTFVGRGGRILKRETVVRPANSRTMAFQSLARKWPVKRR